MEIIDWIEYFDFDVDRELWIFKCNLLSIIDYWEYYLYYN